jgi:hypothetical protein
MKFQCPHCRANSFRLVTVRGKDRAECLECRQISPFSVSAMLDASGRRRMAEAVPDRYEPPKPPRLNGHRHSV